ncbi:MAG: tetratricopeptide repeat protein [Bacteroidota bacterium]
MKPFLTLIAGLIVAASLLMTSCGAETGSNSVTELEAQYRELTSSSNGDQAAIRETMMALAAAYEQESKVDSLNSAEYLYKAAEMYETNMMDVNKALQVFDRIIAEYPNSERAADALFKKGYVTHNVLKDLDKAKVIYQQFLSQYPDHELATSAQFELEFLGVPAEDLLEKIQEKSTETPTESPVN